MRRLAILLLALAPLAVLLAPGGEGPGRLLFAAGWPGPASALFTDARWKGTALAAAGRWDEAASAFGPGEAYNRGVALTRAGRYAEALAAFDEALGRDAEDADAAANREIVAALLSAGGEGRRREGGAAGADATKQIHGPRSTPELSDAKSTGSGLVGTIQSKSTGAQGQGSAPKSGRSDKGADAAQKRATGSAGNAGGAGQAGGELADITKMMAARDLSARRTLDHHAVLPTRDWLDAVPDDPGQWLKLHVKAERARRRAAASEARDDD